MNILRSLFQPTQPSIYYEAQKNVSYLEIEPSAALENMIYCYWELKTNKPLEHHFSYRVVSDGCVDVLVETSRPNEPFITGFDTKFTAFDLGKSFCYMGVRFFPTGFPLLYDISATNLVNQFLPLDSFIPHLSTKIGKFIDANSSLSQVKVFFDQTFEDVLQNKLPLDVDKRIFKAIEAILLSRGNIDLNTLDVGISDRQLRRLFQYYLGASPKVFAKVVRFQSVLCAKPSSKSLKQNKVFYDAGYYDQAHFIKEFKSFYGVTPSKAFGR